MTTTKKIALVTGANRGIGLETVRQLAPQGYHVLLAARSLEKAAEAAAPLMSAGLSVEPVELDVTSDLSVEEAVDFVTHEYGGLDVLINNAGIFRDDMTQPPSERPVAMWQETLETNLLGVIRVTSAFLPLIKKSPAGRIVNLSSILGSLTSICDPASPVYAATSAAYDVSKTALNAYTVHLAFELRDTQIKINSVHPGWVKTDMGGEDAPMDIVDGAKTSVALATIDDEGPTGGFFHNGTMLPW